MSSVAQSSRTPQSKPKRKRAEEQKFYAVQIGRKPGVYYNWPDCQQQTVSYPNARYKSFLTSTEAEDFVKHGLSSRSPSFTPKYYAVLTGHKPGIYTDWPSAHAQIKGASKPRFKAFATRVEAESFMKGENTPSKAPSRKKRKLSATEQETTDFGDEEVQDLFPPGTGPLRATAEDGFDDRIILDAEKGRVEYKTEQQRRATKMHAVGPAEDAVLEICTDGSTLSNGTALASAGIGIYFGKADPRNRGEGLDGPRQTNQRAELTAISRALDLAPRDRSVRIVTDSMYAINCCTKWLTTWRGNGWINSKGKPVENRDLIEGVADRIAERAGVGSKTSFRWIKGHEGDEGNEAADRLAVAAAEERRRLVSLTAGASVED